MERRTKLYGAMSQAQMEEAQLVEEHGYPEEQIHEHDLAEAEYQFDYMQWDGNVEEDDDIQQEQSSGHVLIRGQPQGVEYAEEDYSEFVEFDDEEDAKRYIANAGGMIEGGEALIEGTGVGSNHYIDEEGMHDPNEGQLFDVYQHTGRRRATTHNCEICGVFLKHPSKIAAHMRTHTGERPFECTACGKKFTQRTPWRMHMKRHDQDLPFHCSSGCGKAFPNASQRNAHDLRHQGRHRQGHPRPHLKPQKRRIISTNDPIADRFEALMEGELGPPVIDSPLFELADDAQKRIDEVINAVAENRELIGDESVMDIEPMPVLPTEEVAVATRRKKSRRAPPIVAECQICGLMLKHPSKIQAHMRSHSGVKPYKCQLCGLSVATLYALKMHHRRRHIEGLRPIPCTWECGRRFVSVSAKNEHERIVHAGIKRYVCSVGGCCRLFSRRTHLVSHRLKDHPGLAHVDEFDDAVDQEYLEEIRGLMEEVEESVSQLEEEEAGRLGDGETEEEGEGHLMEDGEEGREEEGEDINVMDTMYEVMIKPSPRLQRVNGGREGRALPRPHSPPSPAVLSRGAPPLELAMPPPIPVIPRTMKMPRIVRPRAGRMQ